MTRLTTVAFALLLSASTLASTLAALPCLG